MNRKIDFTTGKSAYKVAFIYIVVASLWIFLSDAIVLQFLHDPALLTEIQTVKGWLFVFITGLLVYKLVHNETNMHIRTRDRLRDSENRYRMLIDQFPAAAIMLFDTDLNVTFADGALWNRIDLNPGDLTGNGTSENMSAEHAALLRSRYKDALEGKAGSAEIMVKNSWYAINTAPLLDDKGTVISCIAVIHDITTQKSIIAALRTSETRYRELFENITNMMLVCSPDNDENEFRIVEVNKATIEMIGRERQELEGHTLGEALPEFPVRTLNETMRDVLELGLQYSYIEPLVKPDNTTVWINITLFKYQQQHVVIVCTDVTSHMESMMALRESEEKFRIISDQSLMAIMIIQDDVIKYANQAMTVISGYSISEMLKWLPGEWTELIHSDDREFVVNHTSSYDTEKQEGPLNITYRSIRKSGEVRWLEQYSGYIQFQDHTAVLATIIDISDQKILEDEFIQSQKMETIGKLASSIIHDFNNLITVISGNADLLLQNDLDIDGRELVEEISDAADKSMQLTRQLLTFSRRQETQPNAVNLNDIITSDEKLIRRLLGKRIKLELHLRSPLNTIYVDSSHMEQILTNLSVNARYAMAKGGVFTIETANQQHIIDEDSNEHELAPPGDYVLLRISDTGIGMDEHTKEHAFEPFFTTREEEDGTGLGLSTCYSIVKRYNGYIFLDSELGKGTTFSILIPSMMDRIQKEISLAESAYSGEEKILVVDEDLHSLHMIAQTLEDSGYKALQTGDCEKALRILSTPDTKPDLIVCHMDMPRMDAMLLKQRICRSYPCLVIAGFSDLSVSEIDFHGNRKHILRKPFTKTELLANIRRLLDMQHT